LLPRLSREWTTSDVIRISLAFLLQHTGNNIVNKNTITETFETAGLAEGWVEDANLQHLIREYRDGEFKNYLINLNQEVITGLSQSNINVSNIRVIDKELSESNISEIDIELSEITCQEEESTEDESTEDQVGINTKTVQKPQSSDAVSTQKDDIKNSGSSKDSSSTEDEFRHSQEEIEKKVQLLRSKLSQVDSLITDAEFGPARQLIDDFEKPINKLKEKSSQDRFDTLGDELQQLEQKCNNRLSKPRVLKQLREIDPYEFEKLVAKIWEKQGWDAKVKSGSGDRGIDVEATKEDTFEKRRHLIQVKRHGENTVVGSEDIQRYASLYQRDERVDNVFVVTSNRFTSEAIEVAKNRDVSTIDGDELYQMLTET
jgi:restriction endonuclease Mrr